MAEETALLAPPTTAPPVEEAATEEPAAEEDPEAAFKQAVEVPAWMVTGEE